MRPPPLPGSGRTFGRTGPPSLTLPLFVLVFCRPDWPDCWLIAGQFEVVQVAGVKAKQCYPTSTYLEAGLSWNLFSRLMVSFFLRPSSWNITSAAFSPLLMEKYCDVSKSIIFMVSAWFHLCCKLVNSAQSQFSHYYRIFTVQLCQFIAVFYTIQCFFNCSQRLPEVAVRWSDIKRKCVEETVQLQSHKRFLFTLQLSIWISHQFHHNC